MPRVFVGLCVVIATRLVACAALADEPQAIISAATGTAAAPVLARIDEQLAARLRQLQAFWPPRVAPEQSIRVEVHGTLDEYRSAVARRGAPIDNPACYFAAEATIVLGFDGVRFAELQRRRSDRAASLAADLRAAEKALIEQLRADEARFEQTGTPRDQRKRLTADRRRAFQVTAARMQAEIDKAEAETRRTLDEVTARLSAAAAHELFHAYVDACVVSPSRGALPVWLNEGLAQVVEHAAPTAELGPKLRADVEQAARWREARKRGAALKLEELLSADAAKYLVHAANAAAESDAYYLAAWAVAQALLNDGKLAPGEALDRFLADVQAAPSKRFERLVGTSLAEWEKAHGK